MEVLCARSGPQVHWGSLGMDRCPGRAGPHNRERPCGLAQRAWLDPCSVAPGQMISSLPFSLLRQCALMCKTKIVIPAPLTSQDSREVRGDGS